MFRDDFVWGAAGSAYQTEGGDADDGKGITVWDVFQKQGGIFENQDASVACDHYHKYKSDYALMHLLGIKAYRFSLNWARILPGGIGEINPRGILFYRNMIKEMKKHHIEPFLTLFHWEFPQALQDKGGWRNKESVEWFGEYAKVVAENFSDLVTYFITINEPQCFIGLGHLSGIHAPGLKLPIKDTFQIAHHALMAHGMAVKNLRKYACKSIKIGYAPTCGVAYPYTNSKEDIEAARETYFSLHEKEDNWTWNVSWFSDPVFSGHYPRQGLKKFKDYLPEITEEDMRLIHQPLDFMGQNIYNGYSVRAGKEGKPEYVGRPFGYAKTGMNWPVTPKCIYWGVKFIYERYHMPIYITENGMDCHDVVSADGRVHDPNRIDFLDAYLSQLQKASDEGCDIRGYFLWTFLDNFEWTYGYRERFGLVYVDFTTQTRIVKDSGFWYRDMIQENGKTLSINKQAVPILFLVPKFKKTIWGGDRLRKEYDYEVPFNNTGEGWVIGAHENGDCTVREGIYAGKKLSELYQEFPGLFGHCNYERFPLLIKMIDAKEDLSIQVHPDDAYAKLHHKGLPGKTECWYILNCKEDSQLVIGHNAATKEELRYMITERKWEDFIRKVPIKKGDFIQIDPGTVHAIKGGVILLEIQQNSDITYRIYDYDRLADGKPRELQIEESLDVITVPAKPIEESIIATDEQQGNQMNLLIENDYYRIWKADINGKVDFLQEYPFLICSVVDGNGLIDSRSINKGNHFILPSGYGRFVLEGDMELIMSTIHE